MTAPQALPRAKGTTSAAAEVVPLQGTAYAIYTPQEPVVFFLPEKSPRLPAISAGTLDGCKLPTNQ